MNHPTLLPPSDPRAIESDACAAIVSRGGCAGTHISSPETFGNNPRMKTRIKLLIAYSWNEVRSMFYDGRVTSAEWEAYNRVWDWLNVRMGGIPGDMHERYYTQHGARAYYARINRVRAAFGFEPIVISTT